MKPRLVEFQPRLHGPWHPAVFVVFEGARLVLRPLLTDTPERVVRVRAAQVRPLRGKARRLWIRHQLRPVPPPLTEPRRVLAGLAVPPLPRVRTAAPRLSRRLVEAFAACPPPEAGGCP